MISRRRFHQIAGFPALAWALAVRAQELVKDRDYSLVDPPQPPLDAPKSGRRIEVIEFFYYGCPHCYSLQPSLHAWLRTAAKDVDFRRMPTIFRETWVPLTRTYYALEAIGQIDKLHGDVFDTVHKQQVNLGDKNILLAWATKKGVDAKKLGEAYDSFSVQTRTQRAAHLTRVYGISGTPSMVIDGRYLTGPSMTVKSNNAIDYDRFNQVLTALVDLARKQPPGAPAKKG